MLKYFFSPNGRVGRTQFWLGIVSIFATMTPAAYMGINNITKFSDFFGLYCLLCVYFYFVLLKKRCHDHGDPGWYFLKMSIPFYGFDFIISYLFLKGDEGPNKYGPDPISVKD